MNWSFPRYDSHWAEKVITAVATLGQQRPVNLRCPFDAQRAALVGKLNRTAKAMRVPLKFVRRPGDSFHAYAEPV